MGKLRKPDRVKKARVFGDSRERALAKRGYKRTPGSGSSGMKGDLRRGGWMVELKATRADSFRVTADLIGKLKNDGITNGLPGVLVVELGTGEKVAVMRLSEFERLTGGADGS